jgi:pyroglutamyl-peptidase
MAGLLVTGFDAFADLERNISERVVRALPDAWRGRVPLRTAVLPTIYDVAGERVEDLIAAHQPEAIVLLGVARSRRGIQLERVALNLDDSDTADNAQGVRAGRMIDAAGPVGYWSTLPLAAMHSRLEEMGVPVEISNHAGTFLCNHVFYAARAAIERDGLAIPCGFIHLPDSADGEFANLLDAVVACLEVVTGAA